MVTTIKITCDGVFIQSNSYLTREQHRSSSVPASTARLERSLRQQQQQQPFNGHTYTKSSHQTQQLNGHRTSESVRSTASTSPSSDKSIVSCERAGHDKKFTISFLNSRQPVRPTSDINNNSNNSVGGVKSNDNNNNNNKSLLKSFQDKINANNSKSCSITRNNNNNNNTKRLLGISLSASPPTSNKSSSTTGLTAGVALATKVDNIG